MTGIYCVIKSSVPVRGGVNKKPIVITNIIQISNVRIRSKVEFLLGLYNSLKVEDKKFTVS